MQIQIDKFQRIMNQELVKQGHKRQLGLVFEKNGIREHKMRCSVCGIWMPGYRLHDKKVIQQFINEGRWDFKKGRLIHCGSDHCVEWYRLAELDWDRKKKKWSWEYFKKAQKAGLVM